MAPLRLVHLLDPRPRASPSIRDSVSIPVDELAGRVHELPSKNAPFDVAGVDGCDAAVEWLRANDWTVRVESEIAFGEPGRNRLWSPNAFLEAIAPGLLPASCLDLGCGSGRDSVYLADLGWEVSACDRLPEAASRGADFAKRYLPDPTTIQWACMDLEQELPEGQFELIVACFFFDVSVLKRALTLLSPGGRMLVEAFTLRHRLLTGRPRSPGRIATPERMQELVSGTRVIRLDEGFWNDRHTMRLLLER